MKYLSRTLEQTIKKYLTLFCIVGITGPRQSGKSTTLKINFGEEYQYISFDDPLLIEFFEKDPNGFLEKYKNKVIFDEIQKVPQLFNYLKIAIDNDRQNYGKYIITGSSQFSFLKQVTESLAGRIGLLSLLPFQLNEIPKKLQSRQILKGSYPELIIRNYQNSNEWYAAYISNYIERDVRSLYNIGNLRDFQRLIMLLAARASQELNMNELANEIGVSVKTIQSWISVLEASYIIFLLPSYHKNLGKRIVKRPKMYFFDTGLVCYLTGIQDEEILNKGPLGGPIFENYIISEINKAVLHKNLNIGMYYFRSNLGLEADLILEDRNIRQISFIEIKNSHTAKYRMIKNLAMLMDMEKKSTHTFPLKINGYLIYKGKGSEMFKENLTYQNYNIFLKSIS